MAEMNTPLANLARDIRKCLRTGTIAAVKGPAGVGKSEMVRAIARDMGAELFTLIGSLADPTDINGFPVVVRDKFLECPYNRESDGSPKRLPVLQFAPRDWMVRA